MNEDIQSALEVSAFLWPKFKRAGECVLLAFVADSGHPANSYDTSGWEAFQNHTHLKDEFSVGRAGDLTMKSDDERTDDLKAACEVGRLAAKLWCLKLREDFPTERFRVYYTELDDPILRFHKVREGEPHWMSDIDLENANESFENALIYDTENPYKPITRGRQLHEQFSQYLV